MLLPCVPLDELLARLAPDFASLAQALSLPAAWQRPWCDVPSAPWRLLVRLVATLPASAAHHECGSGGLARHLLRVAQGSALRHRAAAPAGAAAAVTAAVEDSSAAVDPDDETQARDRVVIALAASLRAIGVIWRQEVQATPGGPLWPRLRYLSDWAREQRATQLSVVWTPGVRGGADGHGALGAAALALVLPPALGAMLGPAGLTRLLALVLADAPCAWDADTQLLSAAAAQARQEGLARTGPQAQDGTRALPILTSADAWRALVRERLAQPGQDLTSVDAPALCSATHTILFLSADPARSLLPDLAARMRRDGPAPAAFAPGSGWPWLLSVLRELAPQQLADETPWCVVADPQASDAAERIMHVVMVTDPQRGLTRCAPALILRNRALWDEAPPAPAPPPQPSSCTALVRCCRDHRGDGTVDAEDLGFAAGPEPTGGRAAPSRRRTFTVTSGSLVTADTLRDLPAVARDLMAVTSALCDAHLHGQAPVAWRHLLAALPQPLPAALVIDVLEAITDQLHDLVPHPGSDRTPEPGAVRRPSS